MAGRQGITVSGLRYKRFETSKFLASPFIGVGCPSRMGVGAGVVAHAPHLCTVAPWCCAYSTTQRCAAWRWGRSSRAAAEAFGYRKSGDSLLRQQGLSGSQTLATQGFSGFSRVAAATKVQPNSQIKSRTGTPVLLFICLPRRYQPDPQELPALDRSVRPYREP